MNLLEDPDVKSRYQKYKYKIKKWENDFIEKYARPPKKVMKKKKFIVDPVV